MDWFQTHCFSKVFQNLLWWALIFAWYFQGFLDSDVALYSQGLLWNHSKPCIDGETIRKEVFFAIIWIRNLSHIILLLRGQELINWFMFIAGKDQSRIGQFWNMNESGVGYFRQFYFKFHNEENPLFPIFLCLSPFMQSHNIIWCLHGFSTLLCNPYLHGISKVFPRVGSEELQIRVPNCYLMKELFIFEFTNSEMAQIFIARLISPHK